jgi:carboxymethylenebutenolidase
MIEFSAGDRTGSGYLALPADGNGPGVLVLHAWWGLNETFKDICERLAKAGFVAFAPDLYAGKTAATIEEAEALMEARDSEAMQSIAGGALSYLRAHPAVEGEAVGAVGFSMGAAWASALSTIFPDGIAAVALFYGVSDDDYGAAHAAFQGHFGETDDWEPLDGVRQMEAALRAAGRETTFFTYPGARHWFVEPNRPEYDAAAAELAWSRTIAFLGERLAVEQHIEEQAPPSNKAELLDRIRTERAALEQTLARLSDEQLHSQVEHGWTVKDLLAHITAWEQVTLLVHLKNQPFEQAIKLDGARYGTDSIDVINEAFHKRDKDKPLPEVLAAFRQSYDQILAAVEAIDEARLYSHYIPHGRTSGGQLVEWVVGDTYDHYREHRLTIEALSAQV